MPSRKPSDHEFRATTLAALKFHTEKLDALTELGKEFGKVIQSHREEHIRLGIKDDNHTKSLDDLSVRLNALVADLATEKNARLENEKNQIRVNTKTGLIVGGIIALVSSIMTGVILAIGSGAVKAFIPNAG